MKIDFNKLDDRQILLLLADRYHQDIPEMKEHLAKINGTVGSHNVAIAEIYRTCSERSKTVFSRLEEVEKLQKSRRRQLAYTARDVSLATGVVLAIIGQSFGWF